MTDLEPQLREAFTSLEIDTDGLTAGSRLRDDLGMDSAEIIDLVCACETAYGISIPDDGTLATALSTVSEVIDLVRRHSTTTPTGYAMDQAPGFTGRCAGHVEIGVPVDRAYQALFDVRAWPEHLPHVREIEVLYDDGQYQEFWMTVASEGESILKVRSVRNCHDGIIEFFQPKPPPYLKHHGGVWRFSATGTASCRVDVAHVWNQNETADDVFPDGDAAERIHQILSHHSHLALTRWKTVLEAEAADRTPARSEVPA